MYLYTQHSIFRQSQQLSTPLLNSLFLVKSRGFSTERNEDNVTPVEITACLLFIPQCFILRTATLLDRTKENLPILASSKSIWFIALSRIVLPIFGTPHTNMDVTGVKLTGEHNILKTCYLVGDSSLTPYVGIVFYLRFTLVSAHAISVFYGPEFSSQFLNGVKHAVESASVLPFNGDLKIVSLEGSLVRQKTDTSKRGERMAGRKAMRETVLEVLAESNPGTVESTNPAVAIKEIAITDRLIAQDERNIDTEPALASVPKKMKRK
jgi:hypothetical protein